MWESENQDESPLMTTDNFHGIDRLVTGERRVIGAHRSIRTRPVHTFMVEGDRAVINWVFEFVDHEGRAYTLDELAFQLWRTGACRDGRAACSKRSPDEAQRNPGWGNGVSSRPRIPLRSMRATRVTSSIVAPQKQAGSGVLDEQRPNRECRRQSAPEGARLR